MKSDITFNIKAEMELNTSNVSTKQKLYDLDYVLKS